MNQGPSKMARGLILLVLAATSIASQVSAQAATATASTCRVRIPLSVHDPSASSSQGFFQAEIRARNKGIAVVGTQKQDGSRSVVLLMDLSGSMAYDHPIVGDHVWEETRQLAKEFLTAMKPGDAAALHVFATRHHVVVPLTRNLAGVVEAVGQLPKPRSKEARALLEGIQTVYGDAVKAAATAGSGETDELRPGDVTLLLSDGFGHASETELRRLAAELLHRGLRVFLLRAGPEPHRRIPDIYSMATLARLTGGFFLDTWTPKVTVPGYNRFNPGAPPSPERVRGAAQMANHMVRSFIWVQMEFRKCDGKGKTLELEVRDSEGRRIDDENLLYPRYAAPVAGRGAEGKR